MKVSFDYDGTLDQQDVRDFADSLFGDGIELWIVSMRHEKRPAGNQDIFDLAEEMGIPASNVIFTNGQLKAEFFKQNSGFSFHLDDCQWQVNHIKNTKAIFYQEENEWKNECEASIK